ncbi:pyrroloquinoline quinone biosynthesis peptide chaperone PqqD [Dokdonella koreensis]|uniref:PqqA binding protein n=1 Tax=Dokdonella koreensis DS-123 TaxID=1300342 RepID=A0A160DYJ6_9GAMM|nr:pyrroloquinoline quinone biosynthesis peptide chaperone PqqD [Dokdonella koreensis]ANB19123.1 Pyrroloquinoline-quinone (PQQ) synthesis protein PqqD [Dokdonella koreensis DS-123]
MSTPDDAPMPRITRHYRLQWEAVQDCHVLLYPEGMVKLNRSAAEILLRCDGTRTVAAIVAELEQAFDTGGLRSEVEDFLGHARHQRWIDA